MEKRIKYFYERVLGSITTFPKENTAAASCILSKNISDAAMAQEAVEFVLLKTESGTTLSVDIHIPDTTETPEEMMTCTRTKTESPARERILSIAMGIYNRLIEKGCIVEVSNGMGDFRDFYFTVSKPSFI